VEFVYQFVHLEGIIRFEMEKIYLFDWGNTIMRDFPDEKGAMYSWNKVEIMPNADKMLQKLFKKNDCYLATKAKDSTKEDIIKALKRVNLDIYFKDIFCFKEFGVSKPSKEYFDLILESLRVNKENLVMVGDNLESDIYGVQKYGIDTILYDPGNNHPDYAGQKIWNLIQLINY
jgi:FMN phosphatase YigB (HAD superfamily)